MDYYILIATQLENIKASLLTQNQKNIGKYKFGPDLIEKFTNYYRMSLKN